MFFNQHDFMIICLLGKQCSDCLSQKKKRILSSKSDLLFCARFKLGGLLSFPFLSFHFLLKCYVPLNFSTFHVYHLLYIYTTSLIKTNSAQRVLCGKKLRGRERNNINFPPACLPSKCFDFCLFVFFMFQKFT